MGLHSEGGCHRDADDLAYAQIIRIYSRVRCHDRLNRRIVLSGNQPEGFTITHCMSKGSEWAHIESPFFTPYIMHYKILLHVQMSQTQKKELHAPFLIFFLIYNRHDFRAHFLALRYGSDFVFTRTGMDQHLSIRINYGSSNANIENHRHVRS